MPISHRVFPSRKLILAVAQGDLTYTEARAYLEALSSEPRLGPGFRQLIDCTGVARVTLTTLELRTLAGRAHIASRHFESGRVAIAAPSDHVFGVARMYEAFSKGIPRHLRVFREMESAVKWLEAPSTIWEPEAGRTLHQTG